MRDGQHRQATLAIVFNAVERERPEMWRCPQENNQEKIIENLQNNVPLVGHIRRHYIIYKPLNKTRSKLFHSNVSAIPEK